MSSTASLASALPQVPDDIANALQTEFAELESRFARTDWAPAELNGARFAEAVLRFLEWRVSGRYTQIGKQLNRKAILKRVENDVSLPDGLRFHVAKCSEILMDIRNKRDVGHLGTDIDVKEMDAQLVMRLAAWTLAEIIREEGNLPAKDAQVLIDRLSAKRLPLVENVGGDLVVVATDLSPTERALVALYRAFPQPMSIKALKAAVSYQNVTRFRGMLCKQAKAGITHVKGDDVYLTAKGVAWVENNIAMELKV
jgi:hypothetical protein